MADEIKLPFGEALLVEHLKGLSKALDATWEPHSAEFVRQGIALIESQAAEIERLTPKPMTQQGTADALNRLRYWGIGDWTVSEKHGIPCVGSASGVESIRVDHAEAIAEKLIREQEAARG